MYCFNVYFLLDEIVAWRKAINVFRKNFVAQLIAPGTKDYTRCVFDDLTLLDYFLGKVVPMENILN